MIDRQMNQRIIDQIMREHEPTTLTNDELELDVEPLTRTPVPRRVKAWVRYGDVPLKVEGEAVAWTTRAVAVTWQTADGATQRAWVWASAVEGR